MTRLYALLRLPQHSRARVPVGPALCGALLALASAASGQSFGPRADYVTGSTPYDISLVDVNGDGRRDMVTANYGGNSVSVLPGQAGGTFGAKTDYATGGGPLGVVVGDVNRDGRPDLITANLSSYSGNTVTVLLGQGGGTFGGRVDYTTGPAPRGIALGDINNDGWLDIVTANNGSGLTNTTVSVLLNLSGNGFGPKTDYATGTGPSSVELGDFNGDGRLDIVTANFGGASVSVLLALAGGGFGPNTNYTVGSSPYDVEIGDVNGDGRLDLVTANNGGNTGNSISVLLGQGGGTFGGRADYTTGTGPLAVKLGDVNGDGRLDVASANNSGGSGNTVTVLLGQAGGTFGGRADYAIGSAPFDVELVDVNGDGRLDLITCNANNRASVLLNGAAAAPTLSGVSPTSGPVGTTVTLTGTALTGATGVSFNGTAATAFTVVNATTITATVPTGATTGLVTVTTPGGPSNGVSFAVNPTVAISSSAGASGTTTSITPLPFTITFSQSVTGFVAADVTVTNGAITAGSFSGSGTTYTFTVTPTTAGTPTTVSVPAGVAQTGAGTGNVASATYSLTSQAQTAAPVVTVPANGSTLGTATPTYAGTAPAGATVTVIVDGSSSGTTTADASGNWTLTVATALAQGSHTVRATAQLSNQTVSTSSNTNTFVVDTTAPTVTISSSAGNPTTTSPIPVTVTFSEAVTGFGAGDVTVTGGAITAGSFAGSGASYTFSVTPAATGLVTVNVPANGAQDPAGNGNVAAPQFSIQFNAVATTWTGAVSADWFTAGNWTTGVPTSTVDAFVNSGAPRYPAVVSGTASAKNLLLAAGASLSQSGGTLALTGGFATDGTFTATGGVVSLQGSSEQRLGGVRTSFWDVTVGAAGARLDGPVDIRRVLTLNGNLSLVGQPLTLLSDAAGTAMVVNNNAAVVSGDATMQRYLDPSLNPGLGYRHYSSPVQSATVDGLATTGFSPVVNPTYNTQGTSVTPFPTVFGYDEARIGGTTATTQGFDYGFFSPGSLATPLAVGRGYTVNLSASAKVALTGTLNNGPVAVGALSRGSEANAGWHLLGNPYPAPLDWKVARAALPAGVIDAVYVYKSSGQYTGTYQFFQNGFGTLPNGLIGAMQGFFVRVSQPVAAFSFQNAWRATTYDNPTVNRAAATDARPAVQLDLVSAAGTHEPAFVYFEAGATAGLDDHFDAEKLPNTTGLNLASVAAGQPLAVNGLPLLSAATVVPLHVGVPAAGTYALEAAALLNLSTTDVYLHDAVTGLRINLKQQPSYRFTAGSAAAIAGRFSLQFAPLRPTAAHGALNAAGVSVYPNPAHQQLTLTVPAVSGVPQAEVVLYNAVGQSVRTTTLPLPAAGAQTTLDVQHLPAGMYLLRVKAGAATITKQVVID